MSKENQYGSILKLQKIITIGVVLVFLLSYMIVLSYNADDILFFTTVTLIIIITGWMSYNLGKYSERSSS